MTRAEEEVAVVAIVDKLMENLNDRKGFHWDGVPEDIVEEWKTEWRNIALREIRKLDE